MVYGFSGPSEQNVSPRQICQNFAGHVRHISQTLCIDLKIIPIRDPDASGLYWERYPCSISTGTCIDAGTEMNFYVHKQIIACYMYQNCYKQIVSN